MQVVAVPHSISLRPLLQEHPVLIPDPLPNDAAINEAQELPIAIGLGAFEDFFCLGRNRMTPFHVGLLKA